MTGVRPGEHPNATAYRRAADAFRAGDLAMIELLVDENVVWHVPGRHPRAGDIHGRAALIAWLAGLVAETGFWLTEHDVFGNDEHVCALSLMGARRFGVDVETRVVSIFHPATAGRSSAGSSRRTWRPGIESSMTPALR